MNPVELSWVKEVEEWPKGTKAQRDSVTVADGVVANLETPKGPAWACLDGRKAYHQIP